LIANNPRPHEKVNKNEKYHPLSLSLSLSLYIYIYIYIYRERERERERERGRERERERESIDLWDILVLSNLLTKKYIIELIYTNFILFFNYK
jgi:hypothetical protein